MEDIGVLHSSFSTADPDVAEEVFRRSYSKARMSATTPGSFRYEEEVHGARGFLVARTVFHGAMTGDNVLGDYVTVSRTVSGRLDWDIRDERGTADDLVLIQRGDLLTAGWGPVDAVLLNLDRDALRRTAAALYGSHGIEFDSPHPLSPAFAGHYRRLIDLATRTVASPAFSSPLVRTSLYRSLAAAVLEGFRLRGDREARRESVAGLSALHRRSKRFLEDHASLPITMDDVAQAVGAPEAEIGRAFLPLDTVTPRQHLRRVRLAAAHEDLVRGDRLDGDTVRGIAARWGFADPSAFARRYRVEYGRSPSQVLQS